MKIARYECRFLSLDGFLRANDGLVADFWKMDVEGAELFVLRGAAAALRGRSPTVDRRRGVCALGERSGYGPWEFFAPLIDLGYRFLFLCRSGLIEHFPAESAPFPAEFEDGYNVVAYVPERHAERIRGLERLRFGTGQAMRVAGGVYPNRPLPR